MRSKFYNKFLNELLGTRLQNLAISKFFSLLDDYKDDRDAKKGQIDPLAQEVKFIMDTFFDDELLDAELVPSSPTSHDITKIKRILLDKMATTPILYLDASIEEYAGNAFGSLKTMEVKYGNLMKSDDIHYDIDKPLAKRTTLLITDKIRNAVMHSLNKIPRLNTSKNPAELLNQTATINSPGFSSKLNSLGHLNLSFDEHKLGPNKTMTYGEYLLWKTKEVVRSIDEAEFP